MISVRRLSPLVVLSPLFVFPAACAAGQSYIADVDDQAATGRSSSSNQQAADPQQGSTITSTVPATGLTKEKATRLPAKDLWKHPGIGVSLGVNGIGLDIAEPIAEYFNVRIGGGYYHFNGNFTSDGAQIAASISTGSAHAGLDYYPWHNGFRVSPQMFFAIQTEADGTVIVPSGQIISLAGTDYVSSDADPLRGAASVNTRKWAPGITIGYGNLSPRHGARWSVPVEFGFYYVGQPNLNVTFTGSACDPHYPQPASCQTVTTDPGFQSDLKRFIARQNNNLSYASFFPVASIGFGYRF